MKYEELTRRNSKKESVLKQAVKQEAE